MTATAATRRITTLVIATAALGAGSTVVASAGAATPATHAVAMYDVDFCNYNAGHSLPSSGGFVQGRSVTLYC